MTDNSSPAARSSSTASPSTPYRKTLPGDEPALLRQRPPPTRFATNGGDGPNLRRRSSTFSDYSLNEARRSFHETADDVLLPTPDGKDRMRHATSNWDSAPLAFALLPAIGGLLFKNGSSIITDIMLLGLAAIFLNWSVRLPWNWYHSAQAIRKKDEYSPETVLESDSDGDDALSFSQGSLDKVPEEEAEEKATPAPPRSNKRHPAHTEAASELYTYEVLALFSCFLFPVLGAYLLHTIRGQLTRPSEGLVSNYNLTIFLLASELRPMAHLIKLIQARTLHLQRVVSSNPYDNDSEKLSSSEIQAMVQRIADLEARSLSTETPEAPNKKPVEQALTSKQTSILTTEVRRTLQPELDALNRAVRRYEKRATLQALQTEGRLQDLESRLNDAISLAAAAANGGQRRHSLSAMIIEWSAAMVVLPLQAFGTLASLPFKTAVVVLNLGKTAVIGKKVPVMSEKKMRRERERDREVMSAKYAMHNGRMGLDRLQGRVTRR
ncbi:hypothetical protein BP5796_06306 [Coleophoma crateriformis]|uniref:Uncharacterized protein n=1 Tax=Coleophoma crateriformis TaxID=565419 RepID=A0A3D8RX92_9HELO|nr:hypothetical protein BP5796_06306 [Coleophoma crateriformis]